MKKPIKFWTLILILGTVIQTLGIWLFSSISMTRWSQFGQPLALGVTLAGIVALLWFAFRNRNKSTAIFLMGPSLGAAYLLAFHVVGITTYQGLLRDAETHGYWISLVRVLAAAVIIHTAVATMIFGVIWRWRLGTDRAVSAV